MVALLSCGYGTTERAKETARVHAHLARVERELRATLPANLTAAQSQKRAKLLDALHDYTTAVRYPLNSVSSEMTPIFVDEQGARCAMAALLGFTGDQVLVQRVARTNNFAYIEDLKDDPALQTWLGENGMTLVEAARVQPSHSPPAEWWQPTAMAFVSGQLGNPSVLAPGVRAGIRNSTLASGACMRCVDSSWAVMAEYTRAFLLGVGSTHQVSLLGQIELNGYLNPGVAW